VVQRLRLGVPENYGSTLAAVLTGSIPVPPRHRGPARAEGKVKRSARAPHRSGNVYWVVVAC